MVFSGAPWWCQSGDKGAPVFIQNGLKGVRGVPGGLPHICSPQGQPPLHVRGVLFLLKATTHSLFSVTCVQHIRIQPLLTHRTVAVIQELSVMSEVRGVEEEQDKTPRGSGAAHCRVWRTCQQPDILWLTSQVVCEESTSMSKRRRKTRLCYRRLCGLPIISSLL